MKTYDIVVIGGGPSGMIAAGRAAELGASVLLLEKNQNLGIKLLMSGGGRCNFTNQSPVRSLSESYGLNGRWLLSGLSRFGSLEIIDFFTSRGVNIKVEAGGRVFPKSDKANQILKVLINYMKSGGVEIKTKSPVSKIITKDKRIIKIILAEQTEIIGKNFIIACGGKSYPYSGSNGDAYVWLKALGHKIINPKAALSRIIVKEKIKELEGLSLEDAALSLYKDAKKIGEERGDFLFTRNGLSGPIALNLSRLIARQIIENLNIKIDFFPKDTKETLDQKIQIFIEENKQADIKNILNKLCHKRLINFSLEQLKINPEKKGNEFTRLERLELVDFLKGYGLGVLALGDFGEAMITVGGVDLKEVNPKTMASKIISNLYLVGEVLDLDGPTGGYNLQVAWTTGYLGGESAVENLKIKIKKFI